jgi:hypothetical protein
MGGPSWLADTLAGVMLATSAYCVLRLLLAWRWKRSMHDDINLAHVAMGVAMAGMLVASLRTLPSGWWVAVFSVMTAWFVVKVVRLARRGIAGWDEDRMHHVSHFSTHLLMAGAMLFMFLVQPALPDAGANPHVRLAGGGMPAAPAGGAGSGLAYLLVVVLLLSAIWHADGLSRFRAPAIGAARRWLAPRSEAGAHIAMCVTMGYMLVLIR